MRFLRIAFLFSLVAFLMLGVIPHFVFADQAGASQEISMAEQRIHECYSSVKAADSAGANVSSLTAVLNDAGSKLDQAQLAYDTGDFDRASDLAVSSHEELVSLTSNADQLREDALGQASFDFWLYVVGSGVGAFAVVAVGVLIWVRSGKGVEKNKVE